MTFRGLVGRSLRFHWRANLGALLGATVGTAILVGALAVGDSVRASLHDMALARLGRVQFALNSQSRFFRAELATSISSELKSTVASVVLLRGTAAIQEQRAGRVQVVGVDNHFWQLSPSGLVPDTHSDSVILNDRLAAKLHVKIGDEILLRVDKPSLLSRDAPLSTVSDATVAMRVPVGAIVADQEFGRFGLDANQIPPLTAYLPKELLQKSIGLENRVNVLLVGTGAMKVSDATSALWKNWQLDDAGLQVRELPKQDSIELRTSSVFLDPAVGFAASKADPRAQGVLTYFVNELRVGTQSTPYSTVSALDTSIIPSGMKSDEILINRWLADDLSAKVGDSVGLTYWVVGSMRELIERRSNFRIKAILPMEGLANDAELMPAIPGLTDKKNCREWEPGVPIDLKKIRDKDQGYWDRYRGTPKALITLKAGQQIWNNRFGNLTAVRFPARAGSAARIGDKIKQAINPASLGLFFMPVRDQAVAAGAQSLDFGQLFLGFSVFLIIAALILTGLMFALNVERRSEEIGTLLAVGWTRGRVHRLLLAEGSIIALGAVLIGATLGVFYTKATIYGLSTIWSDAISNSSIRYHGSLKTLVVGGSSGFLVSMVVVWLVVRTQARSNIRSLLVGEITSSTSLPRQDLPAWRLYLPQLVMMLSLALAGLLVVSGLAASTESRAEWFFGSGTFLLIAGLTGCRVFLIRLAFGAKSELRLGELAMRNGARRLGRSLSAISLLAFGAFLVVSIGASRKDDKEGVDKPSSGTGGYALYADSTLPIYEDLNSAKGQEAVGLEANEMAGVQIVPMRLREGDEASCLNLNRAQVPSLLGVASESFRRTKSFTFAQILDPAKAADPWTMVDSPTDDGAIPVVGDTNTVAWSLGKSLGDTIPYVDDRGNRIYLRIVGVLANSVLQGRLIASEQSFVQHFPSQSGHRVFLISTPTDRSTSVSQVLTKALENVGLTVTPAHERLAAFNAVENAYLSIFAMLGGLGLVLGSVGLGLVVLRNVLERRSELALLRAIGFGLNKLKWLVFIEHVLLLSLGLFVGVVAALVAVLPALRSPSVQVPVGSLAVTLLTVFLSGLVWTWIATTLALRGRLLVALRNE